MKASIIVLTAVAAAAAAGAAIAAKPEANLGPAPASGSGLPSGQCFRSMDIKNHTIADRQTLLIDVNNRDTYRITMRGSCLAGAIPSDPLITRSPPGSPIICKPIDMDLAIGRGMGGGGGGFTAPCLVDSIVKLTPEQVAALPKKLKP